MAVGKIQGTGVALVTPFTQEGEVDFLIYGFALLTLHNLSLHLVAQVLRPQTKNLVFLSQYQKLNFYAPGLKNISDIWLSE